MSSRAHDVERDMTALLTEKNVVIYGAGGGIGRGMAQTFAREGANLHLAGRTRAPLEKVAAAIGGAHVAAVDALDEAAVGAHSPPSWPRPAASTSWSTSSPAATSRAPPTST
jgi:shikimate 5-dehydrogenase